MIFMAVGYLYIYSGAALQQKYQFNAIETIDNWGIDAPSLDEMQLPGSLDKIVFDGKTRDEDFVFTFIALPTTYNSATPGTGTFLDQLCDIFYLYRNQGAILRDDADIGAEFFWFAMAFHSNATLDASHDTAKSEPTLTTGFQNGTATYGVKCLIKNVRIKEMDNIQRTVKVTVSLRRVGKVFGYG